MDEIRASVEKILAYKKQIDWTPDSTLCCREDDRVAAYAMARQAITCCEGTPFSVDEHTFFCGCADYRTSGVGNDHSDADAFPAYMAKAFSTSFAITAKDPDKKEIRAVAGQAAQYDKIVLSTCNAHLFPGQLALAQALAQTGKPLMVAALRNPYDIPLLPPCQCKIAAYDYSIPAFEALKEIFYGSNMTGGCPVTL